MTDQRGFTLLSTIMALSILLVICGLLVSVSQFMAQRFHSSPAVQKETQKFFLQTTAELHRSQSASVSDDRRTLLLSRNGEHVTYSYVPSGRVIRQVDGRGYEIVLQQVSDVSFQIHDTVVSFYIKDKSNRDYYWTDTLYLEDDAVEENVP